MPRESRRERSRKYNSSDSSDSDYSQKSSRHKKSDYNRRSYSKERSHRRRHRSSSRSKKRNRRSKSKSPRYYSSRGRSTSRDRTLKKKYSRSSSRDRSYSRDRSKSRDRSDYSRNKYKKSKSSRHESRKRSSSRSSSPQDREGTNSARGLISLEASKKYIVDDTVSKIEKAIKAAEAAGLKMCKLPTTEFKDVKIKEDMPTIHDRNVLDELNNESFVPRQFTSSRTKKLPDNIVIDLEAGSIKVPEIEIPKVESVFHPDFFQDEKIRMERWVKKMYSFRQRALNGDI